MPTALQLNGVRTRCRWCSKHLTDSQRANRRNCCSEKCTRDLLYANGNATYDAMPEPKTDDDVSACNRQVAEGKARMRRELDALKFRWTPLDESPEAERRLRESLGVEELEEV